MTRIYIVKNGMYIYIVKNGINYDCHERVGKNHGHANTSGECNLESLKSFTYKPCNKHNPATLYL